MNPQIVTFLIKCPDQKGIIAKLTSFFYIEGFNIISSQQYTNSAENKFFMRVRLVADSSVGLSKTEFEGRFTKLAELYDISWKIDYGSKKHKVAIMVSHTSHNLYDLLHRHKEGKLNCEVSMVVSNHTKLKPVADMFGIPFHHTPVTKETRRQQEKDLISLYDEHEIDLIVLARYMQILSENFISHFPERIINIHHSFFTGFSRRKPIQKSL